MCWGTGRRRRRVDRKVRMLKNQGWRERTGRDDEKLVGQALGFSHMHFRERKIRKSLKGN